MICGLCVRYVLSCTKVLGWCCGAMQDTVLIYRMVRRQITSNGFGLLSAALTSSRYPPALEIKSEKPLHPFTLQWACGYLSLNSRGTDVEQCGCQVNTLRGGALSGSVALCLRCAKPGPDGACAALQVRDDGCRVMAQHLENNK